MPRDSQLWVTTHARELADGVAKRTGIEPVRLTKQNGETRVVGQRLLDVDPEEDPKQP